MLCVGSVEELKTLSTDFPKTYDLHKPFVDELQVHCPRCQSIMKREKEVIDCWYDSGSSFFAQWHYPFENKESFKKNFPVDFISEALDQTRGWFYSLLAISTFLFQKNPYKTVLTLGLVLDKDNQKMSKSKKNYVDPIHILDHEGADALRWYLVSSNAPWMSTRFYEEAVRDTLGKFILTFWNSYNFFATYASLDSFNPVKETVPYQKRGLLDKWILSRFHHLIGVVESNMKQFEIHKAARAIEQFLIDDFSNWYLRRSRKRLWVEETSPDKLSGYSSMYEIFLGFSTLLAPFIPFITEEVYQNLKTKSMPQSVHLCNYPEQNVSYLHTELETGMAHIRELVEEGRALRSKIGVNVRYPLQNATIVCAKKEEKLLKPLLDLLQEELNVKTVSFAQNTDQFMVTSYSPKYAQLGPKYKQLAKTLVEKLQTIDNKEISQHLTKNKKIIINVENQKITLLLEDFERVQTEKPNIMKATTADCTLFLNTTLTPELETEGLSREIVRRIQSMRKELNLKVEDRIETEIHVEPEMTKKLAPWQEYITGETRSKIVKFVEKPKGTLVKTWDIDKVHITIGLRT